jgi:hypothetical protein
LKPCPIQSITPVEGTTGVTPAGEVGAGASVGADVTAGVFTAVGGVALDAAAPAHALSSMPKINPNTRNLGLVII